MTIAPAISRIEIGSPSTSQPRRMAVTGMSSVTSITLVAPERRRIWKKTM
jgi:hypothetical protein